MHTSDENLKQLRYFILNLFCIILCIFVLLSLTGCSVDRKVIKNPELDQWDDSRKMYKNLFAPQYGYLEETEFDSIDFRKPHEKGTKKYSLLTDPRGDIDRAKGYNPSEHSVIPDFDILYNPTNEVQITWIRHASFLIQLGTEYQILVDPVIEQLDGLVGTLGKYTAIGTIYADSPLAVEDLPIAAESENSGDNQTIIVAISHDHYDHLNFETLKKLPESTHYYVPLKVEKTFSAHYQNVTGMDWYTHDMIDNLAIKFLPANHRSGRTLNKESQTLWGGWLFEWNGYRVYFAGDTGYSAVFKDIRKRVGEIDICLMPISAWFQRQWHFAPEDAIEASQDLECKVLIPWGWGAWINTFEHILVPPRRLQYAWDRMQPENMELRILKMGETYSVGPLGEEQGGEDCD
jgi:L-ascorbate metabolism protein UlaG (beta-lactamase superfamily)